MDNEIDINFKQKQGGARGDRTTVRSPSASKTHVGAVIPKPSDGFTVSDTKGKTYK